jgi:N-acetylmuramoyl-L-alanine amidase
MKRISLLVAGITIFILFSFTNSRSPQAPPIIKVNKVVIDAGHGGNDPGALGPKYKEKNIALAIALKLGGLIKENFPEIEVIYTRTTDVFVELYNRARIANESKADLFISIHCNSTKTPDPSGTETWVMGLNKSEANLEVAKKENAAILMEADYSSQYDGFDPNSPEANIIFSLYQNVYLDQSLNLAAKVQSQFENRVGRVNRGVKQAGFLVLYKTTMPGILVETGFISNPEEEEFIASDKGQSLIASAIYRAFKEYKNGITGGVADTKDTVNDLIHKDQPEIKIPDSSAGSHKINVVKPPQADTLRKIENGQQIIFRVQFTASAVQKPMNSPDFKGMQGVKMYFHNGLYKYTVGNENTLESAVILQHEVQQKGYKDAFVVAFMDEKRITPEEALELLKKQKK